MTTTPPAATFDAFNLSLDEMDFFAEMMGFEIEDIASGDQENGALFNLPEGTPMRKLMRCFATIITRRESPDATDDEIGPMTIDEVMEMLSIGEDANPPQGQPD